MDVDLISKFSLPEWFRYLHDLAQCFCHTSLIRPEIIRYHQTIRAHSETHGRPFRFVILSLVYLSVTDGSQESELLKDRLALAPRQWQLIMET